MAFQYPWGNLQGLNLTWFVNQFKKLREDWATAEAGIEGSLDAEIQKAEDALSDVFDARDAAAASATAAGNSASAAALSATAAQNSASAAASSATLANNKATAAGLSEAAAAQSASQAALSASNAGNAATQAGNSATAAGNSATAAGNSATAAATSETNAAASAADAEESAQRAEDAAASASGGGVVKSVDNVPIASVDDALDEKVVELVVDIDPVQAGTGDPSPNNVRAITGWTGANVVRTGKNLFGGTLIDGYCPINPYIKSGIEYYVLGDIIQQTNTYLQIHRVAKGVTPVPGATENIGSVVSGTNTSRKSFVPDLTTYDYYLFAIASYTNLKNVQITLEAPTQDTYQAPNIANAPITFPTEAGTIYGGTLTNQGSDEWLLSINMLNIIFNDNTASFRAGTDGNPNAARIALSNDVYGSYQDRLKMISNQYNSISITASVDKSMRLTGSSNTPYSEWIIIYDNRFTDEQTMKTILAANPVQIVYPLYQPIEYTITSEAVEMLLGNNNIWADTGNVNLLRYYADSKDYIDAQDALVKALIAKELDEMKADTALTANDFRIVNNTLYRITAPVASGATLTPGTNCEATTIATVLKTLLT